MSAAQPQPKNARLTTLGLWVGVLLPPVAWAAHLQFVYAASEQVCRGRLGLATLNIISAMCLLAALCAGVLATGLWFGSGAKWPSDERSDLVARQRFLSAEGMLSGLLFAIVLVGQWLALVYLSPCAH
jgi:hypothetical protein